MDVEDRSAADLVDLIYQAAVEPERWLDFVQALSDSCGGAAAGVSLYVPEAATTRFGAQVGLLAEYTPVLLKLMERGLPWEPLATPHMTERFVLSSEQISNVELRDTDFYREWLQPQGLAGESQLFHVFAWSGETVLGAVGIYPRVGLRPLDGRDHDRCNALVPHLRRAYRVHRELHGEHEKRRALAEVIDRFPLGVLLLDGRGRHVVVNESAERILAMNDGMAIARGQVVADLPWENKELQEALLFTAEAADSGIPGRTRLVSITRPSGQAPFSLMLVPLMDVVDAPIERDAVSAIFVSDSAAGEIQDEVLQELYGFTPAEAALVVQLVRGGSLAAAARARGIQLSTARGHLKKVSQKTGTHSQRDLMRLVLAGIAPIRNP